MNIINPTYLRRTSPTQIKYILVTQESTFNLVIPPSEFDNVAIDFMRRCPRDLLQMVNPLRFFELSVRYANNNSFHFSVIYDKNIQKFQNEFDFFRDLRFFFIDCSSNRLQETIGFLKAIHRRTHFYLVINNKNNIDVDLPNQVDSPASFIWALISNRTQILADLSAPSMDLAPFVNSSFKALVSIHTFEATRGNYWMINNLIGNYEMGLDDGNEEGGSARTAKAVEDSKAAVRRWDSFDRQLLLRDQVDKLDYFIKYGLSEGIFKPAHATEPLGASLILVAPFISPDIKARDDGKDPEFTAFLKAVAVEQTRNYTGSPDPKVIKTDLLRGSKVQKLVSVYLDNMAFLHATFNYSPAIRLPLKGASINRELSFFRTDAFFALSNVKAKAGLVKNMERFGSIYKHKCIAPELAELSC